MLVCAMVGTTLGRRGSPGYFDLTELAEGTVFRNVPAVERDLYWEPQTVAEIKRESRGMAA